MDYDIRRVFSNIIEMLVDEIKFMSIFFEFGVDFLLVGDVLVEIFNMFGVKVL